MVFNQYDLTYSGHSTIGCGDCELWKGRIRNGFCSHFEKITHWKSNLNCEFRIFTNKHHLNRVECGD